LFGAGRASLNFYFLPSILVNLINNGTGAGHSMNSSPAQSPAVGNKFKPQISRVKKKPNDPLDK